MIQAVEVHKTYHMGNREVHAVRGVSLEISRGQVVFVLGPSGSGKSTLLYLLGALDRPSRGKVLIDGKDLTAMDDRELSRFRREKVGFIFQSFNLVKNLTALENVLLPDIPRGIGDGRLERAHALLQRVGLELREHHRPSELSGGEQQRVAIARALAKNPLLVLGDEPTGELDSATGSEVFSTIRSIHREQGITFVIVTHDTRFIESGDVVFTIKDGQIVGREVRP